MPTIEQRIEAIEKRNKRVEMNKAWETSFTRRVCIMVLTYIVIALFFIVASLPDPYINAIVPSLAFLLSTFTMQIVKKWWIKKR